MRKLLPILLILTMIMAMSACSDKASDQVEVEAQEKTEEATETKVESLVEDKTETEDVTEDVAEESPAVEEAMNLYPEFIIGETETSVDFVDKFGSQRTVTKNPEKVVSCYNSHLGLWYFMGGESLTKVKGSSNVPETEAELIDLGSSYSVSLEAIIALEPNLVILASNVSSHVEMAPVLNEMGIETVLIDGKTKSYERFQENAYLFAKILGTEEAYKTKIEAIKTEIQDIIDTALTAQTGPRVAPIFATSKSMTIESDVAQVGELVTLLGGQNIYGEVDLLAEGETRVPFSIEAIVTQNPEVILISTMGSEDAAKETIDAMIAENPVWNEVDAVVNDRVFYLPKDLSVYKPNERYAEAFQMVAELLYPELFLAQ